MDKINLNELTVEDIIIADMNYIEEENKTEIEFNSPICRGMLTLDFNDATQDEDGEYENISADLALEASFDDKEYENAVFDKLFELVTEAMTIIAEKIETLEDEQN